MNVFEQNLHFIIQKITKTQFIQVSTNFYIFYLHINIRIHHKPSNRIFINRYNRLFAPLNKYSLFLILLFKIRTKNSLTAFLTIFFSTLLFINRFCLISDSYLYCYDILLKKMVLPLDFFLLLSITIIIIIIVESFYFRLLMNVSSILKM